MKFPWHKYEEIPLERRNTLQVFVTPFCNLSCTGCFAKSIMENENSHIDLDEYVGVIKDFLDKGGKQVNLLGGEPFLHPEWKELIKINRDNDLKSTVYTNGSLLDRIKEEDLMGSKLRVSIYSLYGTFKDKAAHALPKTDLKFDANFMVSSKTNLSELVETANYVEENFNCDTFFISSIRELNNFYKEFFHDTKITMPVIEYKQLVHWFLRDYKGDMDIHVSKRGVFESTKTVADNKCRFSNYIPGGKIVQCPYDIVNSKFQNNYEFGARNCQHNNSCLMSKVKYKKKN